jgi:hypothetical protein
MIFFKLNEFSMIFINLFVVSMNSYKTIYDPVITLIIHTLNLNNTIL